MFKIGEFARVANVSVHLLRHYDDIALFVPATIDKQSGYRYYSVEQLPRLHRIIALRELGLTLEQIAKMLDDNIQDCEIQGMLLLKQQQVEQIIEQEHARLRRIETRLKRLQLEQEQISHEVVVKSAPELNFLSSGYQVMSDETAATILRGAYDILEKRNHLKFDHSISFVYDAATPDRQHHIEVGYAVKASCCDSLQLDSGHILTKRFAAPVETMATVVHHGTRTTTCQIYGSIFRWMEANHYQFCEGEYPRELYYQANADPHHPDHVLEIQVPIIKNTL